MATQDDFLFNLNDFSSGVNHGSTSNHPTPSSRAHDKSNSNTSAHNTTSILAGLNAFTPEDGDMDATASANFADQLALWTNANFSFDGPTGHALLLDDEKDEEAKREERERRDREEAARGSGSGSNSSRRGESSRDGASANAAASIGNSTVTTPSVAVPTNANGNAEPTHRDHKLQADQQQQQQYFGAPASVMGEGRRPGYNGNNNAHITDRRRAENDAIRTPTENAFSAFNFLEGQKQQQQQQQQPHAQVPQQQNGFSADTNGPYVNGYNAAGVMSPELLQALAFQQILSGAPQQANGNHMALASLFGGAGGPQLANGAFSGAVHGAPFVPSVLAGSQPPFGAAAAPGWGFGGHGLSQQNGQGTLVSTSPDVARSDASGEEGDDHQPNGKKRRQSKKSSNGEESAAARRKREEQEEIAQALRDELPPLELIDTGNPEADAEANRVAIEEDKRRRNTAASARFRIKKKQREQALEQAAKELERRVQDLEEENNRLNTENGWLKSLITIRPSGQSGPGFGPLAGRQMGPGASFIGTGMQPQRDTGLQPRGVGTPNGVGTPDLSRHVTPQQQQQQTANTLAGGKRGREE